MPVALIVVFFTGSFGGGLVFLSSRLNVCNPNTGSLLIDACFSATSFNRADLPEFTSS